MIAKYLIGTTYMHQCATLNCNSDGTPHPSNLYGMASFMITCGYLAHRETNDNGAAPRARIKEILGDWLTEDRERNLYLRHTDTLDATAEEIAERLFSQI